MCGNGLKVRFVNEFVNTTNHHVGVSFQHSHLPNQNQVEIASSRDLIQFCCRFHPDYVHSQIADMWPPLN